eukprot:CAMPEP_0177585728 /NCGR_PEP_ID=MMETSP0419_2-20121207/4664_1 /TAXON_ID=582737 /ORGANISM="Tetraselmis sp., Strain GSL018" /LENGTH=337 /DNA_ID=CAMNT_0019075513 /DNA_START=223 /DNA_END=1236 /DNA_ORIENTATION=+
MVGDECVNCREKLQIGYPVRQGVVHDWDDMVRVWEHAFLVNLGADPTQSKVLLTEPPLNSEANRERMLQIMFEHFGFQGAAVQVQAVLALYAQGLLTGLVLDSGHGTTYAVPVVEGYVLSHLAARLDLAGRRVTENLLQLLLRGGYALNPAADLEAVARMKESLCYVAADCARELQLARETTAVSRKYTLPDGQSIRVESERFMACEPLFRPELLDLECPGVPELIFNCIQEVDIDNRTAMYQHVLLTGGSTMLPGFPSRVEKELRQLYLERILKGDKERQRRSKLRVEDPPQRRHMAFLGAAVLADIMQTSREFWVTRADYEEDPRRALLKCCGKR